MTFFPCNTGVHIAQKTHSAENIHTDKAIKETSLADNDKTYSALRGQPLSLPGSADRNAAANRAEGLQIAFFQMRGRGSLPKRK